MKNPSLVSHISPPDMFGKPQESKLKFCGFFSITAIWFSPVSKWKMLYLTLQLFSLSLCLLSVVPRGWTVWSDTEWLRVEGAGVLSSYLLPGKTADSSGGWWCRHIPNLPQHAHTWIYHNISTHTHTCSNIPMLFSFSLKTCQRWFPTRVMAQYNLFSTVVSAEQRAGSNSDISETPNLLF